MKRLGTIFIKNLKEYRKKCGFTQAQLAEKVKVTPNYIGMLEIKKTITETVIQTVREAFEENIKRCSPKSK